MANPLTAFHINDFPRSIVNVQLDSGFAGWLFSKLLNVTTIEELAKVSGDDVKTILRWVRSYYEGSKTQAFIKLDSLLCFADYMGKLGEGQVSLSEVEKNIVAIRGYGRSGVVHAPHLPVYEDSSLVRIIVHLIGDGFLSKEYASNKRPVYTNSSPFLLDQFATTLSKVFGDVSSCLYRYSGSSVKTRSYVAFSQWIGYVLKHWYPDARYDHVKGSLPERFLQLPLELKVEIVRTFGDDDGHVGAHSIRFTSGGSTILEQIRGLVLELMEATLPQERFEELVGSVGEVRAFRSWFILDLFRPLFGWYSGHVGFSHPERAERLEFQLACDVAHLERGLDGFDLDFLVLVGLGVSGSVGGLARRFTLREDFLYPVVQRLRKLGWLRKMEKRKSTTFYQTSMTGRQFLERVFSRGWDVGDRLVLSNEFVERLRGELLGRFGSAAAVARAAGIPETTVRGYLQGGRQWMSGRWVVALAGLVGWGVREVGDGVVVAFGSGLAPRYEQCDFLGKAMMSYRWFGGGKVGFEEWLGGRRREVVRERRLLDDVFAEKLKNSGVIRVRILALAEAKGGEVSLEELRADSVLSQLVSDRYAAYLADRMCKLVDQGVFSRVRRGVYRLAAAVAAG